MKLLVIGSGGREHALGWKLAQSPRVQKVFVAPGNGGTATESGLENVAITAIAELIAFARKEQVHLTVVGPEAPLAAGVVDAFQEAGLRIFGPVRAAAQLEASKDFAKSFMARHGIPTARHATFTSAAEAKAYVAANGAPIVVKADGLAAGKGVVVAATIAEANAAIDDMLVGGKLGEAGGRVVIEEFLEGEEVSVLAITDGAALLILDPVMDHKQVKDGDQGPNTGGMGVCSPVSVLSKRMMRQVEQHVLVATLHGMRLEELEFRGVLFVGLMLTESGPRVLEYNCRFGDPEAQALMRRMRSDLVPYLLATAKGRLSELEGPEWDPRVCIGVVGAAEGYPGKVRKGDPILGLDEAETEPEVVVFHGATRAARKLDSEVLTDGGRVLCVTSLGKDLGEARQRAYTAFDRIQWEGRFCRRDIGLRQQARPQASALRPPAPGPRGA